jgi:hypothetical protein
MRMVPATRAAANPDAGGIVAPREPPLIIRRGARQTIHRPSSSNAGRAGLEETPKSERTEVRAADRAARLFRSAVLIAGLAGILLVSYDLAVPLPPPWSAWRLPTAIATAGGLVLVLAWPTRREAMRARTAEEVALMLGVASTILGIAAAMLVAYGMALHFAEDRVSTQSLIYRLTHPWVLASILTLAAPAALSGGLGWEIARRRARAAGRVSAAGLAFRFSALGLGCAGLIASLAAAAAIYRWLTWG